MNLNIDLGAGSGELYTNYEVIWVSLASSLAILSHIWFHNPNIIQMAIYICVHVLE